LQKGVFTASLTEKREERGRTEDCSPRGSRRGAQVAGDGGRRRWRPPEMEVDGERWESPESLRARALAEK
jgi:hypothetical protein